MTAPRPVHDPADLTPGAVPDPARTISLAAPMPALLARAIAALANSRGGDVLVGVETEQGGAITRIPGIEMAHLDTSLREALRLIDPPAGHLVSAGVATVQAASIGVVHVRLSPSAPHLHTAEGVIYVVEDGTPRPLSSRQALDSLYARSRGERERADRMVEAMIEKLAFNHYAFYSLGLVACTERPSAEPFLTAHQNPSWLALPEDSFVAATGLHKHSANVWPGELEIRSPGDAFAYIRVTRSGCAGAGEVRRKPHDGALDTVAGLHDRISALCATVLRLLRVAEHRLVVPHFFLEGVRGTHLITNPESHTASSKAPRDSIRHALTAGDAADPDMPVRLADEAIAHARALYSV